MFTLAQSGVVRLKDDTMHYVRFGHGPRPLIMLPGLGDGLTTVKGTALPMALLYRAYSQSHTVYVFMKKVPEAAQQTHPNLSSKTSHL